MTYCVVTNAALAPSSSTTTYCYVALEGFCNVLSVEKQRVVDFEARTGYLRNLSSLDCEKYGKLVFTFTYAEYDNTTTSLT